MIQIHVDGILSDIKWLPNGNLLGFGSFTDRTSSLELRKWSFWQWSPRTWSQVEDFVNEPGRGAFATKECRLKMNRTRSRFLLGGAYDCWYFLDENNVPKRVPLPFVARWKMAPDENRFLAVRNPDYHAEDRILTEVFFDQPISLFGPKIREAKMTFSKHAEFFYGSTSANCFIGRIDYSREVPSLLQEFNLSRFSGGSSNSSPLSLMETNTWKSLPNNLIDVWYSSDWRVAILEHDIPYRKECTYGRLNLEYPHDVEKLQGLVELQQIEDVCFDPSNRYLAIVARESPVAFVYDTSSQMMIRRFDWRSGNLRSIDFSCDGSMIAAICGGDTVTVWDVDF